MNFHQFLETTEQTALIEKLKQTCQDVYGAPAHPEVIKRWQTKSVLELQQELKWLDTEERTRIKINKQYAQRQKEKEALSLNGYERCEAGDTFERIICGGIGKEGMPMHKLDHMNDDFLHDYYGIYVGSADEWLDWMVDDGYCDQDIICIYEITIPPTPPFYLADDPASGGFAGEDASKQVPDAQIIFSTIPMIPRQYVKLRKRIGMKRYWKEREGRENRWG